MQYMHNAPDPGDSSLGFNRRICGTSRRRRRLTHFADISEEFALLRDKMAP